MFQIIAQGDDNKITMTTGGDYIRLEITGYIGKWSNASVSDIKLAIKQHKSKIDKAVVYINSEGGSVFEANEIANFLNSEFKEVKVEVGALAASAASYFLTLFHATAKENSQIMIHAPRGCACGTLEQIQSETKLIENLTTQYLKEYATKMGLSTDDLQDKWRNDWWMTAKEAHKYGLVDVISSEKVAIDAKTYERMVACGVPNIESISKQETKPKKENMNLKLMAVKLGLPDTATEADVQAKLDELKAQADEAKTFKAQLTAQKAAEKKAQIKSLLDDAEKDHKINANTRVNYEALAEKDFDQVKAIIENLPAIVQAPSAQLKSKVSEAKAGWTYEEYLKNDPEAFEQLPEAKQKELVDAHYNNN